MDTPVKSAQRANFKGDGQMAEELKSPKRKTSPRKEHHHPEEEERREPFFDWLMAILPIFLAGFGLGIFLFYLFSPASLVEVIEDAAEGM